MLAQWQRSSATAVGLAASCMLILHATGYSSVSSVWKYVILLLPIRRFQYANLDVNQTGLMAICKKKSFIVLLNAARTIWKWKHVEAPHRSVTCQGLYFNLASSLFQSREAVLEGFVKSHCSSEQTYINQLKERNEWPNVNRKIITTEASDVNQSQKNFSIIHCKIKQNENEFTSKKHATPCILNLLKGNVKNISSSFTYLTFWTFYKLGMPIALPYFGQPLVNMPLGLAHSHRQVGVLQFESLQPASGKGIGLVNKV